MHHTFLSLLLPTALYAAALSLGAPAQATTSASAPTTVERQAVAPPAAGVLVPRDRHDTRRPFALLPPSGRAG
ncbi:MAG: hypothetical protein AB7P42_22210 [Gammaproteobacteria bacterium]